MGKKLPYTPNNKIRSALRILWMRSRERSTAIKNSGYCCVECGIKQTAAKGKEVKLDVHHMDGIDWDGVFDAVRKCILHDPSRLMPLCKACHIELDENCHAKKEPSDAKA